MLIYVSVSCLQKLMLKMGLFLLLLQLLAFYFKEHFCKGIFKHFHLLCILLNFLSFILIIKVLHFYF